jgi:hypothetical protein
VQHIGKSKVTKLNAKAGVVYPLIRLPKTYANELGTLQRYLRLSRITGGHFWSLSMTEQRLLKLIQKLYNFCLKLYNLMA